MAKFTFAPEPKLPFLAVIVRSTFWREDLLHADIVNQMRAPDVGQVGPLLIVSQRRANPLRHRQDRGAITHIEPKTTPIGCLTSLKPYPSSPINKTLPRPLRSPYFEAAPADLKNLIRLDLHECLLSIHPIQNQPYNCKRCHLLHKIIPLP